MSLHASISVSLTDPLETLYLTHVNERLCVEQRLAEPLETLYLTHVN